MVVASLLARFGRSRTPGARFCIYAQGRTGSSLLRSLLNAHPDVSCDGEILADPVADPVGRIRSAADRADAKAYGYKVKIYQLIDAQQVEPQVFLSALDREGYGVIHVQRRNALRHAISNAYAEGAGQFHFVGGEVRPAVTIDVDRVLEAARRRREHAAAEETSLEGLDVHRIVYEDHLLPPERHQTTADAVFGWLGLSSAPVTTPIRRSVAGRLEDRIANYTELVAAAEASEFAGDLNDPAYKA